MSAKKYKELKSIMRSHLCNRCGTCAGLSEGSIVMEDREGRYFPKLIKELRDDQVERIWEACSGKYFDFPAFRQRFYNETKHFHVYTGPYERIGIAYSNDPEVRANGASGGLITQILLFLLEKKMIQGVVTLGMDPEKPWLNQAIIATTKEQILDAAQSKYCISSVNEILPKMESFDGDLAYVGLPPQVQSIRKLQSMGDPSVKRVKYIFGPFYGNTLHFSSIKSLLRTYHEKDHTRIEKLYFRHGEWPGNMRIEMKGGRVIELKKFHANYLIPFHILKNSLYCTDLANEFTDISGGDAWAPVYEERGKGYSIVFSRTKQGDDILQKMIDESSLDFEEISESEAISMHSHGYDLKKRGSFIRIRFRKLMGKAIPDYGYKLKGFPVSRYLMEAVISFLFLVLGTAPARWFISLFSPVFIGKWFEKARTFWKKSTHTIKRTNLT